MYRKLEQITEQTKKLIDKIPIVEPKLYEKIFNDAVEEYEGSVFYINEESVLDLSNKLHEQADNIVNAVDTEEYEKIADYRNAIVALKEENEKLLKIAYKDELTGAYGRRWLFAKKVKDGRFIDNGYLVLIDMNKFKQLNDKYGHNVGDSILKLFVEALQNKASIKNRACDIVRFGGDEFLIIIGESNDFKDAEIEECLLSLKKTLVNKIQIKATGERISIDFSFGIANYLANYEFRNILEIADKKMFASKAERTNGQSSASLLLRDRK